MLVQGSPSPNASAPTQKDVAEHAGVSVATVSRVLNAPDTVAENRRSRVLSAIEDLGYVPSAAGRMLASRRSRMVGAVFPRLNSILFGSYFSEMQQAFDEAGFMLALTTTEYSESLEISRVRDLLSRGVEAMVLVGRQHAPETHRLLDTSGVPYIHTWTWSAAEPVPQIGFCNRSAMAAMADYVAALGHRRIGYISGIAQDNDRVGDRLTGLREGLQRHGVTVPDDLIVFTSFGIEEGGRAFLQLYANPRPPTAVICGSDIFAFGALREARRAGLTVPDDITITGFDDTELAEICAPALTTIRTPRRVMARRCAQALIDRLEHGRRIPSLELATDLIVRESAAPPP